MHEDKPLTLDRSVNYPVIIVVAVLTTGYTAYGGVLVSIVTDQVPPCLCPSIRLICTGGNYSSEKNRLVGS